MKKIKIITSLFVLTFLFGCTSENSLINLDGLSAPSNISALTTITQDNSGNVTFLPRGEGVTRFAIYFGDTAMDFVSMGATVTHKYKEGVYQVRIIGYTVNGKSTEKIQTLTVSFLAPTNLVTTVTTGPNKSITVSASAKLETYFQVYFGESPTQVPVDFMENEVITFTYTNVGTYKVRIVALSGGKATSETTQDVIITNLVAAPTPTVPASSVISLFSDAYTNVSVNTWRTDWSAATLTDISISGNATKKYSGLNYVGVEATTTPINASAMTHFHTDVWSSDFTVFRVKLVDFGANGAYGGGDDVEHEITFTSPAKDSWVSLDIPLSSFTGLTTRAHIAQLIYSASPAGNATVYVDNVYFYNKTAVLSSPAPTPTLAASKVISMFSDAYTNVKVDTWRTSWSVATLTDMSVNGNAVKKYSGLDFVGIETATQQIDATGMTHFHTDVWSSDFTVFKIKLVDFGPNAAYGGGDDKEFEITYTAPAKGTWISLDIPLSSFTGLTTRAHIAQLIYVGAPTGSNTIYIDNVYFHN